MPRVAFEVPDDLTKELSAVSQRIYRTHLNHLAKAGYGTRDKLLHDSKEVVATIWEKAATAQARRVYLSAVFWILHEHPLENKRAYYDAFQLCKTAPAV